MYLIHITIWCFTLGILSGHAQEAVHFRKIFEWNYINFSFPSSSELYKYAFEPGIYTMFGIEVYKPASSIYFALPRTNRKARITLARISLSAEQKNPLLSPFPSWEMNRGSDCSKLQDVTNMEIDRQGIMWVLDAKRNNKEITTCPARVALFDLKNNGKFMGHFIIPEELCSWKSDCVVNDIILDGDFAYLTYINNGAPGLMVLNTSTGKFWTVGRDNDGIENNSEDDDNQNYYWIALSPPCKNRSIYIVPQASKFFYKIRTKVLHNQNLSASGHLSVERDIKKLIDTSSAISDSEGDIYFGYPKNNSVFVRDYDSARVKFVDKNRDITNPGTFSFDNSGYLYMSSAPTELLDTETKLNTQEINFRILRARTGSKSYQHPNLLKQSAGRRHLHFEDIVREKDNFKRHQDELKRHIEEHKRRLQKDQQRIKDMEKLQKDQEKQDREEQKRQQKEEQERLRTEERRHRELENRRREEEKKHQKEEQERLKEKQKTERENEKREREERTRREREEQQRIRELEKRRQGELKREEQRRKEELKRIEEENKRNVKLQHEHHIPHHQHHHDHQLKDEFPHKHPHHHHHQDHQLEDEFPHDHQHHQHNHQIPEHQPDHNPHHQNPLHDQHTHQHHQHNHQISEHQPQKNPHHQFPFHHQHEDDEDEIHNIRTNQRPIYPEYPIRHQTVRKSKPVYPTTPVYSTSRHTVRRTRPQYPTTEYSTSRHTVRRTRPSYTRTTEYSTTHPTRQRTRPYYTQTTQHSTSQHQGTRPHYIQTTTRHQATRPHYTQATESTTRHQATRPHYTQATESTTRHQATRPHYPGTTGYHQETKPHYTQTSTTHHQETKPYYP